jgi:hypothetical protein
MISFRYHVVSIVAVLLALAAGVVLGGGPLRDGGTALAGQPDADRRSAQLEAQVDALRAGDRFADDFATTIAPGLLDRTLRRRVVTLVALPTARQADVSAIEKLVAVAGGRVGGSLRAGEALVDVGDKQLVDELGAQLASQLPGGADGGTYERMGALVARAVGTTRPGGARVDRASTTILGALDAAKLLSTTGRVSRRGDLVLFVDGAPDAARREGGGAVVASLATSVDAGTAGAVVAGPLASASGGGAVRAVRADARTTREVSTVDALGRSAGQAVTVLALAGQAAGTSGQYGTGPGAEAAVPGASDSQ